MFFNNPELAEWLEVKSGQINSFKQLSRFVSDWVRESRLKIVLLLDEKENVVAENRRMDLVVTYRNQRYVIELKIWYGEKRLQDGIEQLCSYLESYGLNEGYILIFNFNSNKTTIYGRLITRGNTSLLSSCSSKESRLGLGIKLNIICLINC
ncbi:GxxExxY protein [Cylindrospermopsis raciborskii]|uniref:GxxExxY protein n=1 Tax=Cylindrospermopsis raciborskii TaxID=77022 RepID=UPI001144405F|nr:hypothetical protein FIV49_06360 [Cylindrospermopsis raciborskii GIHE 2018]